MAAKELSRTDFDNENGPEAGLVPTGGATENRKGGYLDAPWERPKDWSNEMLTEKFCKQVGIDGVNVLPYWARNPNSLEGDDRVTQIENQYDGAFLAKPVNRPGFPKSDFVKNGDLVLMGVPREVFEAQQLEIDNNVARDEGRMMKDSSGSYITHENTFMGAPADNLTLAQKREMVAQARMQHVQSGMIGGVTAGMNLWEAEQHMQRLAKRGMGMTPDQEEEMWRRGGRANPMSQEQYVALMQGKPAGTGAREQAEARRVQSEPKAKSKFAMPNSGFPGTGNSALKQVQNRGRRV